MSSFSGSESLDDELVSRARAGDRDALEELLADLRPLVLRRCSKLLPHRDDAEDAAQDALVAIAQHLDGYDGTGSFRGWVTVVASNSARMTYRRLRRRWSETGAAQPPEPTDPRTTSVVAGTRLDLMEALTRLEERHPLAVEPFVLRDLGSLPYDEIAVLTGTSLSTVRDRIHVARTFVRSELRAAL